MAIAVVMLIGFLLLFMDINIKLKEVHLFSVLFWLHQLLNKKYNIIYFYNRYMLSADKHESYSSLIEMN